MSQIRTDYLTGYHLPAHLPHLTPLSSEDRLSAAVGASADSLLSFSADRGPLRVGRCSEWGVGGMGGEGTRPRRAAPTNEDVSSFFGGGGRGRSTAEDRPATPR